MFTKTEQQFLLKLIGSLKFGVDTSPETIQLIQGIYKKLQGEQKEQKAKEKPDSGSR
jgi:hypothetical protein